MSSLFTRKKLWASLVALGFVAGFAWWQGLPLLASFYVERLVQADAASREGWVTRVVGLDEAAVPLLLSRLGDADLRTCDNLAFGLVALIRHWGPESPRAHALLKQAAGQFQSLNGPGKTCVLQIPIVLCKNPVPDELIDCSRTLALQGLAAADAATRLAALQLILCPALRQNSALLAKVVPLLKDSDAEVRKAAVVAVGGVRALVADDDLLPLLHDADVEVQGLCELALRSRGLQETHIVLARLISDKRPGARLEVLRHLREAGDLEPGVWLKRLCEDPAPAVRAAAVRAAASQAQVDLRAYLDTMARQDPSPTVRQLAGHYLKRAQPTPQE